MRFWGIRLRGMRLRKRPWLPARPWLGAQRVHIRPSRAGLAFAALLLALWIAAVNYRLGLGYALTYFAAACAIADMLFSSRNLAGLSLAATPGQPVFAGGQAFFRLRLINRSARSRHAIHLTATDAGSAPTAPQLADIAAHGETTVSIGVAAAQRGWLGAPPVRLSGNFPLGLFHAWCHWQPDARVLVYPRPEAGAPPLPAPDGTTGRRPQTSAADGAPELAGVRAYQPGDPLQRLAWRQIARHDGEQVFSKHFQPAVETRAGAAPGPLMLDHAALQALAPEARLSRLTAWVLAAERAGMAYGLRLGPLTMAPGLGASHRDSCLRALALHALPQDQSTARPAMQATAPATAQAITPATAPATTQTATGTTAQPVAQAAVPVQPALQATALAAAQAATRARAESAACAAPSMPAAQLAQAAQVEKPAPTAQAAQAAPAARAAQAAHTAPAALPTPASQVRQAAP